MSKDIWLQQQVVLRVRWLATAMPETDVLDHILDKIGKGVVVVEHAYEVPSDVRLKPKRVGHAPHPEATDVATQYLMDRVCIKCQEPLDRYELKNPFLCVKCNDEAVHDEAGDKIKTTTPAASSMMQRFEESGGR